MRNYGSFIGETTVDMSDGCSAVTGANGSGKSTLIGAPAFAIFGPEGRSLEPYFAQDADGDTMEVELVLDHAGERYRIRRSYSTRGRGRSLLDFERFEGVDPDYPAPWLPLTDATQAGTQQAIEDALGLSKETFEASAYLAQGRGDTFTAAQPKDRKRLLADALGLSLWEDALDLAAADRRRVQADVLALDVRLALLEEQAGDPLEAEIMAKTLTLELGVCEEDLAGAAAAVQAHEAVLKAEEKAQQQWETLLQAHRHAEQLASAQRALGVQAQVARERLDGERTQMHSLERLEDERRGLAVLVEEKQVQAAAGVRAAEEINRHEAEAGQLARRLSEQALDLDRLLGKLETLTMPGAVCDRCQQELDQDASRAARASLDRERAHALDENLATQDAIDAARAAAAQVEIPAPVEGLAESEQRLTELAQAQTNLAAAQARIVELEQTAALLEDTAYLQELGRLEREAAQARQAVDELEPPDPDAARRITDQLNESLGEYSRITGERDRLRVLKADAEAALRQIEKAAQDLEQARDQRAAATADLDQLTTLERAFGRDGVPAWIVEQQAIPAIEHEANRILSELGGAIERIELRTERELKSGGTRDALDIVCVSEAGARSYETYSGGERTRADIALRLGLASLLSHRRGTDVRCLMLDEPSFLDTAGMTALAQILRDLVQRGVFDQTFLVSHQPELSEAFDQTLVVTRNGAGSEVTVS